MANNNPLRKPLNRAEQLQRDDVTARMGIKLFDVDSAIFNYMNDTIVPKLKLDNAENNGAISTNQYYSLRSLRQGYQNVEGWECSKCKANNYVYRKYCYKCTKPRIN